MRVRRLPFRLILPITLVLLVVVLGALQYHWLGQVSAAEREQLQRSLSQRAHEFADDFDREIGIAYSLLTLDNESLDTDPWTPFAKRYDTWRERARFPEMVRSVYLARADRDALVQYFHGDHTIREVAWPDSLAPVKRHVNRAVEHLPPPGATKGQVFTIATSSSIVEEVPALVIPVQGTTRRITSAPDVLMAMRLMATNFVIVELDREVLTKAVVPALVARHFPERDADQYRIAVVGRDNVRLFARGVPEGAPLDQLHADATVGFFTTPRTDLQMAEGRFMSWRTSSSITAPAGTTTFVSPRIVGPLPSNVSIMVQQHLAGTTEARPVRLTLAGWHIVLQHAAGSLDAAVTHARRRNLGLSFGILAILAAGVGLIVVNAQRSERLAAQQMDFVATVSHELRTPLAVIRSAAQNLAAGVVDDPTHAKRYGDLIESEGRRLTDMVEQVLEYAGLSGNQRPLAARPIDLGVVVGEVVASCEVLLDAQGVTAEVTVGGEGKPLPLVVADEEALRRAVNNLLTNAVKYGADGRWVGVTVSRRDAGGTPEVAVAVADRGRGIDADDLPHVFEPFYRGRYAIDQQIHGNGLGLSLVKRIAEAHGGRVTVTSTPGAGATFAMHFPAAHTRGQPG